MQKFRVSIPLSIYIHLPWCVQKCPYCDFNSHEAKNGIPEELYVNALIQDLDEQLSSIQGRVVHTLFFGGGTPSLFSPQAIEKIILAIQQRLPMSSETEITLEANPGTIDQERFIGFRQAGVNRLSIGIQSLQDEKLKALGRIHNRDYALRAIEYATLAGFDNFNLDIMHGLPNQSINDALADVTDALRFSPKHFSWYQLTLEPNTLFHHKPPTLPQEEVLWDIQEQGKLLIDQNGYHQYEVSAYSQPGFECLHNLNYWEFGDYLGIGAGAHSKITDFENEQVVRHWQKKNPRDYLMKADTKVSEKRIISDTDLVFEFMLNALRLTDGVSRSLFVERTGLSFSVIDSRIKMAIQKKLLEDNAEKIKPTELGERFLNDLVGSFMS